jgi:hypothetical protein
MNRSYCSRARRVDDTKAASAGIIARPLVSRASAATAHNDVAAKDAAITAGNIAVTTARFRNDIIGILRLVNGEQAHGSRHCHGPQTAMESRTHHLIGYAKPSRGENPE